MPYADDARTIFADMLGMLDRLVDKAEQAGSDDSLLAAKLAEDMFPLETQFRIAVNQVLLALGRVCAMDVPLHEEPYASWTAVREGVRAAASQVEQAPGESWTPPETEIDMTLPNDMRFVMTAAQYMRDWILPNFYFHATTAYALLRQSGLPLGKIDFLAHMMRYARAPEPNPA